MIADLHAGLRPAAELVGVDPGEVAEPTHGDVLHLLERVTDAVLADRADLIRALHADGLRDAAIGERVGLGPKAVESARRRLGIEGRPYAPPATSHPIVRELHARGLTIPEMMEAVQAEHGLTWTRRTVEQYLYELGLSAHPVRGRRSADQPPAITSTPPAATNDDQGM